MCSAELLDNKVCARENRLMVLLTDEAMRMVLTMIAIGLAFAIVRQIWLLHRSGWSGDNLLDDRRSDELSDDNDRR